MEQSSCDVIRGLNTGLGARQDHCGGLAGLENDMGHFPGDAALTLHQIFMDFLLISASFPSSCYSLCPQL